LALRPLTIAPDGGVAGVGAATRAVESMVTASARIVRLFGRTSK